MSNLAELNARIRQLAAQGIYTNRDLLEQVLDKGKRLREGCNGHV